MSIDSQDRKLSLAMRRVLDYAKQQMPDSIICVLSFTQGEDGSEFDLNKIATNCNDRSSLKVAVVNCVSAFADAPVVDLTEIKGSFH